MRPALRSLCLAAGLSVFGAEAGSQAASESCERDAMLVFDGSGSMAEMGFNGLDFPRIQEARKAVRRALPKIAPYRNLGLIIYGPGPADACANIDLKFPPMRDAAGPAITQIEALTPDGDTPLTQAVLNAAEVLQYRSRPGVIVLVTDGKETCGGAPCQLAAALAADAPDLTVHVIGFQIRGSHFNWESADAVQQENGRTVARCLADRTGGLYVAAETVDQLTNALLETLVCPLLGQQKIDPPSHI